MSMITNVDTEVASSLALMLVSSESRVSDVEDRTIALYDKTIEDLTERNQILEATTSTLEGRIRQLEALYSAKESALQERIKLLEGTNNTLQQEVLTTTQTAQEKVLAAIREKEIAVADITRTSEARITAVREEERASRSASETQIHAGYSSSIAARRETVIRLANSMGDHLQRDVDWFASRRAEKEAHRKAGKPSHNNRDNWTSEDQARWAQSGLSSLIGQVKHIA